jgi:CheY-like chemotaxis protein
MAGQEPIVGKTVLLVEDEALLRLVAAESLGDAGYSVLEAADGQSGLDLLRANPNVAAIVSDICLPGLSGNELAEAALALRPDIKMILITGHTEDAIPPSARAIEILFKPLDTDLLTERVRKLIGD